MPGKEEALEDESLQTGVRGAYRWLGYGDDTSELTFLAEDVEEAMVVRNSLHGRNLKIGAETCSIEVTEEAGDAQKAKQKHRLPHVGPGEGMRQQVRHSLDTPAWICGSHAGGLLTSPWENTVESKPLGRSLALIRRASVAS